MRQRLTQLLQRRIVSKLARYFLVGGFSALTEGATFAVLVYLAGIQYVWSAVLAFVVATGVNYLLSLRFVFDERRYRQEMEIAIVYAVSILGAGINIGVMVALVEVLSAHTMLAKVVGTGSAFLWNFLTRYLWIFRCERC